MEGSLGSLHILFFCFNSCFTLAEVCDNKKKLERVLGVLAHGRLKQKKKRSIFIGVTIKYPIIDFIVYY